MARHQLMLLPARLDPRRTNAPGWNTRRPNAPGTCCPIHAGAALARQRARRISILILPKTDPLFPSQDHYFLTRTSFL